MPARNDLCHCGSGKKYKKCCLSRDEAERIAANQAIDLRPPATSMEQIYAEVEELDALSNSVLGLIHEKRFEEAEKVCQRLLKEYPDQVDGLDRLAMTYEAQGRKSEAAVYYRKAAGFMCSHEGADQEFIDEILQKAEKLEARS